MTDSVNIRRNRKKKRIAATSLILLIISVILYALAYRMGRVVNNPLGKQEERKISDILYKI